MRLVFRSKARKAFEKPGLFFTFSSGLSLRFLMRVLPGNTPPPQLLVLDALLSLLLDDFYDAREKLWLA